MIEIVFKGHLIDVLFYLFNRMFIHIEPSVSHMAGSGKYIILVLEVVCIILVHFVLKSRSNRYNK